MNFQNPNVSTYWILDYRYSLTLGEASYLAIEGHGLHTFVIKAVCYLMRSERTSRSVINSPESIDNMLLLGAK